MFGSDGAAAAGGFEPGEIAGMRSASVILLVTAALTLTAWIFTGTGMPITSAIDVFLGVQLFRLRHSWRVWAMLRAGIGISLGALIVVGSIVTPTPIAVAALGLGQFAYSGSLLLLLFGTPDARRVQGGQQSTSVSIAWSFGTRRGTGFGITCGTASGRSMPLG